MHFRLVKPVKRKGTINLQFNQRIPTDVKDRAVGLKLHIPVGPDVIIKTITSKDNAIRLSLRTAAPADVKIRHAEVAGYLENVWQSLRQERPVTLDAKQSTALAEAVYREWAEEKHGPREVAVELLHDRKTWVRADPRDIEMEPDAWDSANEALNRPDPLGREPEVFFRPLVERVLPLSMVVVVMLDSDSWCAPARLEASRGDGVRGHRGCRGWWLGAAVPDAV